VIFLIIAKDVVERDASHDHGYHEPAHEVSHGYAEPSYGYSDSLHENEYLQEMLGPDPAVSVLKTNQFREDTSPKEIYFIRPVIFEKVISCFFSFLLPSLASSVSLL
jgi:hypothetical protein